MYRHVEQLLTRNSEELKSEWQNKRQRLLDVTTDPTDFFVKYIEDHESLS